MVELRERLDWDFTGTTTVHLDGGGTANGYDKCVLQRNTIDDHARAFYGHHSCHYLASAISCMTDDWPMVTLTGIPPGYSEEKHVHTAVVAPDGRVLDIFGTHSSVGDWHAQWADQMPFALHRHDGVRSEDITELLGFRYDDGRPPPSGRMWWTEHTPDGLIAAHQHFARAVLNQNGYGHHLRLQAHSPLETQQQHAPAAKVPAPRPETPAHTQPGGTAMSSVEDLRLSLAAANQRAAYAGRGLQQADLEIEEAQTLLAQALQGTANPEAEQVMSIFVQLREHIGQALGGIDPVSAAIDSYMAHL